MRLFFVSLSLLAPSATAFSAYQQQLVPIIREIKTSSTPSVTEWKTFIRMTDFGGTPYVSLVQVAELLNGHLRWAPVSKTVDLSVHNETIRFPYDSTRVWIDGRPHRLERASVKNQDGFWVPVSFFASPAFFRATRAKLEWPPAPPAERKASSVKREEKDLAIPKAESPTQTPTLDASRSTDSRLHAIRRIVIDPGHGGRDPGAVGPHGIEEKTINLQLAQKLADLLRDRYQYEVLLTRTDDTFVPLEGRAALANRQNADLFISIHCNASLSSKLKGFEVYFLSERASDPHADAVARFENAPLALEGKRVPSPSRVAAVLRSLVKTANINEASALGALIDRHMGERLSEPSLGVKQAAFYVLRGAEMPAVLIETAFVTNPKEEKLLQKESFRKEFVEGLADGIVAYDQRKASERVSK
jgi:N-acetylmuramoyl-L-alanine amidase